MVKPINQPNLAQQEPPSEYLTKVAMVGEQDITLYSVDGRLWSSRKVNLLAVLSMARLRREDKHAGKWKNGAQVKEEKRHFVEASYIGLEIDAELEEK